MQISGHQSRPIPPPSSRFASLKANPSSCSSKKQVKGLVETGDYNGSSSYWRSYIYIYTYGGVKGI